MIAFLITTTAAQAEGPAWVQVAVTLIVTLGTVATAALAAGLWRRTTQIRAVAEDTNRAVNHVGEGEPPLIKRVDTLERRHDASIRWMHDALHLIGEQLGVTMPNRRDYDQPREDQP